MTTQVGTNTRVVTHELMADAVFDHYVVPYLSTPLKKMTREVPKEDDLYNFETRCEREQFPILSIFEEAHKVAELYFGLASLSACNRHYREKLKEKKKQLADRIIHLLDSLPTSPYVSIHLIRDAIRCGSYLSVIKIYFYYKPQALYSRSTAFGTPSHQAVNSLNVRSISFIAVVLQIDKKQVQKGNQSLLLVPDIANLMLESLILDEGWVFAGQPGHPRYAQFIKEQAQIKNMLAKHACELGIEDQMIQHAEDSFANRIFDEKDLKRMCDLIAKAKKELAASKPPIPLKTNSDIRVDLPKKVETIPEKKPSSLCSRIWKAIVYIGSCRGIGDFIKFLKRSFK